MNLALSDEQVFLREAARGALSRFKTLEAAREALDTPQGGTPHSGAQASDSPDAAQSDEGGKGANAELAEVRSIESARKSS